VLAKASPVFTPGTKLVPVLMPVEGLCCGKSLTQKRFGLEARVGIAQGKQRFQPYFTGVLSTFNHFVFTLFHPVFTLFY